METAVWDYEEACLLSSTGQRTKAGLVPLCSTVFDSAREEVSRIVNSDFFIATVTLNVKEVEDGRNEVAIGDVEAALEGDNEVGGG